MAATSDHISTVVGEEGYLQLLSHIRDHGVRVHNRTGIDTLSVFGAQLRFDCRKYFPLLTTKRVFWRGVLGELLWFISGSTDVKALQAQDIHIWDGNSSAEFLAKAGLPWRAGDIGPAYGYQWRHWGAPYTGADANYAGSGRDQLSEVIEGIRKSPDSRRLVVTAWNPSQIDQIALPPCHAMYQFRVLPAPGDRGGPELHLHLNMRSADVFLGVPFNIASYAALLYMVARLTNLRVGELIISIGDAHIYTNHLEAVAVQLSRQPGVGRPTLRIDGDQKSIDDFRAEHFVLSGYEPQATIPAPMAV